MSWRRVELRDSGQLKKSLSPKRTLIKSRTILRAKQTDFRADFTRATRGEEKTLSLRSKRLLLRTRFRLDGSSGFPLRQQTESSRKKKLLAAGLVVLRTIFIWWRRVGQTARAYFASTFLIITIRTSFENWHRLTFFIGFSDWINQGSSTNDSSNSKVGGGDSQRTEMPAWRCK